MSFTLCYDNIDQNCQLIAEQIHDQQIPIDCILGVMRGGMVPAVILSHKLNVSEVHPVVYSSKRGRGDDKFEMKYVPHINHENILIVDDITDSGYTLLDVVGFYLPFQRVYTAAVVYKQSSIIIPDFFGTKISSDADWVVFPWESNSRQ